MPNMSFLKVGLHRVLLVIIGAAFALLISDGSGSTPTKAASSAQAPSPASTPASTRPIILTDPLPDPKQQGVQWFGATGHTLRGPFLAYWQQHGGLSQFGYPLTEEFFEPVGTDNKPVQVQYFERNRLELHPENQPPYDVLLGTLGRDFHSQDPPATQQPYPALYFPETGHNLGGKFLEYWQSHGWLAVHGYPITEPAMERSTNGKEYMVQWFERSRMELHPENAGSPYEVLLGLLGRQLSEKKGYPFGWYPLYGRAADWSWVAGQFFADPRLCPDCGCDTVRFVKNSTRPDNRTASIQPIGQPWTDARASGPIVGQGFPVVVFGHTPSPSEPKETCAAPGYIVQKVQANPSH